MNDSNWPWHWQRRKVSLATRSIVISTFRGAGGWRAVCCSQKGGGRRRFTSGASGGAQNRARIRSVGRSYPGWEGDGARNSFARQSQARQDNCDGQKRRASSSGCWLVGSQWGPLVQNYRLDSVMAAALATFCRAPTDDTDFSPVCLPCLFFFSAPFFAIGGRWAPLAQVPPEF